MVWKFGFPINYGVWQGRMSVVLAYTPSIWGKRRVFGAAIDCFTLRHLWRGVWYNVGDTFALRSSQDRGTVG